MKLALVLALVLTIAPAAQAAGRLPAPAVPMDIEVPVDLKPFLKGHAIGTQNFICAPANTEYGWDWHFIGPQATVFNEAGEQILTHFQSANPLRNGAIHATWQHSRDTSAVWAAKRTGSLDPVYVAPGAIEWLLLDVTGQVVGPDGGDKLAHTTFIQRVNTEGGVKPPASQCTPALVNTRKLVPYTADYYFY